MWGVIDSDEAWAAFEARDLSYVGRVFAAVRTTRIYCRPGCPAKPNRENVSFFATAEAARAAGYRACKRCKPDEPIKVIRWAVADSALGPMLVAASDKGICRLAFDEDGSDLARRFPRARLEQGGDALIPLIKGALAAVADPRNMPDLPLDLRGTPFQRAIWAELRRIPEGETRTYAQMAAAVGKPAAIRAAGTANGQNPVSILVPCHRVIRTDGTLGGYAYGLWRKRWLLDKERV